MTSLAAAGQLQFKPKLGVFYMLAAITVLASTDAMVKWSSTSIHPVQIGFSRFVISLIMVLWLVGRSEHGFTALRTKRPFEHAARAFCAAVELTAFYFAISRIPLPTAMSIVSASPIFGTLLGVVFLRERLRFGGWLAVFAGFLGVLLVVQPEEGVDSLYGTIAVLTSVFLWCFAQLFARRLSTTESNFSILFYYAIGGTIILGLVTPFYWVNPMPMEWVAILRGRNSRLLRPVSPHPFAALCADVPAGAVRVQRAGVGQPLRLRDLGRRAGGGRHHGRRHHHRRLPLHHAHHGALMAGGVIDRAEVDCVVIGAGVIGLACARRIAQSGSDVLILEAEGDIGSGVSARNSEVIHAGIYYPTGSLKARLCVAGRTKLYAYCADHGIAARKVGKLVVATASEQMPALQKLMAQARANGGRRSRAAERGRGAAAGTGAVLCRGLSLALDRHHRHARADAELAG